MTDPYCYKPLDRQLLSILAERPHHRGELVTIIHKPRTTIYEHLDDLILLGHLEKYPKILPKRGRPLVYFKLVRPLS